MENFYTLWFSTLILAIFISVTRITYCDASDQERQAYIVYMGALPQGEYSSSSHHASMLQQVVDIRKSLIRSYTRSFNAFAAYLTEQEREKLAGIDGVVSVFQSQTLKPQTTRSWDFMGFPENIARNPITESDIIVGVIDTGIWPESESFSDLGLAPIPKKWKGACNGGKNFTCNKKIIGARWYGSSGSDHMSVRDTQGHGSHTASIAAGTRVKGASFFGIAQGTARGGVPSSRIAAYKVCDPDRGCHDTDILAAFDDAIADGVDFITISIGGETPTDLTSDSIAIGSFHAMEKGILTVNSAGNSYNLGTTASVAPWMLSVAASNIDRKIVDKLILGNGQTLFGNAVNSFDISGKEFPLILGKDAAYPNECEEVLTRACWFGCLDRRLVEGKILVCNDFEGANEAYQDHAIGLVTILKSRMSSDISFVLPLAAAILTDKDLDSVHAYINATRLPRATISKSEDTPNHNAPVVTSFSSKGPNLIIPEILKPDLTAPGVDILAAFSPVAPPSSKLRDNRSVKYNILSGTSMACPHAAGAAAYVKSLHPDWSPSAIKSALMTTAWEMNATKSPEAEFAYGAGHIDPVKAANPGLVYETSRDDYIKFFCNLGHNIMLINNVFGGNISCPVGVEDTPKDLNYPSMAYKFSSSMSSFAVKFPRTVTNVGKANSTYSATITRNSKLNITVVPSTLSFKSLNEKISFVVTVTGNISISSSPFSLESASLVWSDGSHIVRSPVILYIATGL